MSEFQIQSVALASQQTAPAWLSHLRQQQTETWQAAAWPGRKTEAWRYTSLAPLENQTWQLAPACSAELPDDLVLSDALRVVFVNGHFSAQLSDPLPQGVTPFSRAQPEEQVLILAGLNQTLVADKHLFASLNGALLNDGLWLHLEPGQRLAQPIYLLHLQTAQQEGELAPVRILVQLGQSAEATLLEDYRVQAPGISAVTAVTELQLGANASLQHYRLNLEEENHLHLGSVHATLAADARLQGFTLASGSRLKRLDYHLRHLGQGADLKLQGIYLPRGNQRIDYHTEVEHVVPHCTTDEVFRGVIADTAKACFNGRIHIHPQAQKTLAEMSNRNLLTSPRAEINTKPELEIYADDVKCAHGATVSQLNDEALFYMTSRGISAAEARVMLSFGFVNELVEGLALEELRVWLRPKIAAIFAQTSSLTRHLIHD